MLLDLIGPGDRHITEHVRMSAHQLGHDPICHIIDGEPGAVVAFGRDARVEHDLEQNVLRAELERTALWTTTGLGQLG
jgi:hypothetical protein